MVRYSPNRDLKAPMWPRNATIEQLLAATCHIGHHRSLVHPFMKSFIAGSYGTTHIINLDYTLAHLRRACAVIREISFRQGIILIIGSRKGQKPIVVSAADRMRAYILYRRWIPGLITNAASVLQRGKARVVDTPFPHFASEEVRTKLKDQGLFPEGEMKKMVWHRDKGVWEESLHEVPEFRDWRGELRDGEWVKDPASPQTDKPNPRSSVWAGPPKDNSTNKFQNTNVSNGSSCVTDAAISILSTESNEARRLADILREARSRGDLQEWMAWNKFATIASDISNAAINALFKPQKSFSTASLHPLLQKALFVEPVNKYIPDQGDNWYRRQLAEEIAEFEARQQTEASGESRNPREIHALDQFLKKNKVKGHVRGEYAIDRVMKLDTSGIKGYRDVKVFRDGSALMGNMRFNRNEEQCDVLPDGSYYTDGKLYDRDGMRYDEKTDSLVFSDGSILRFQEDPTTGEKWLAVIIGSEMYDVSSTVMGSAAKREVLEKAEDLIQWRQTEWRMKRPSPSVEGESPREGSEVRDNLPSGVLPEKATVAASTSTESYDTKDPPKLSSFPSEGATARTSSIDSGRASNEAIPTEKTTPLISAELDSPLARITPREPVDATNVLRGLSKHVEFKQIARTASGKAAQQADLDPINDEDFATVQGSELLALADMEEGESIDKVAGSANTIPAKEEFIYEAEPNDGEEREPTAFRKMFQSDTTTMRPDLIILLNPRENRLALREATNNQIPTIGIIDTDTDPRCVTYSIPANDDSLRSVEYIMGVLSRAGEEGMRHRATYTRSRNLLIHRAETIIRESARELKVILDMATAEEEAKDPRKKRRQREEAAKHQLHSDDLTAEDVKVKYTQWYNLPPETVDWNLIRKLISQHMVLAQNEIRRLQQDTSGWTLQQHLDMVKTSLEFPNVPEGMMEELAHTRATVDRHEWADATDTIAKRRNRMGMLAQSAFQQGAMKPIE